MLCILIDILDAKIFHRHFCGRHRSRSDCTFCADSSLTFIIRLLSKSLKIKSKALIIKIFLSLHALYKFDSLKKFGFVNFALKELNILERAANILENTKTLGTRIVYQSPLQLAIISIFLIIVANGSPDGFRRASAVSFVTGNYARHMTKLVLPTYLK